MANFTVLQTDIVTTGTTVATGSSVATTTLTGGGNCIPLPGNCSNGYGASTSATVGTCTQCYPGFGLIFNVSANTYSCQPCAPGCVACDFTGVCQQCNATKFLAPNQCQQCPYNCSVCANATYCFNNCTKNYQYNAVTGQCLPNGAERILLAGFALISVFLYFL